MSETLNRDASSKVTTYPFELPKLRFSYDAFEPYIDAKTMEIHHSKHHRAYIENLNSALQKYPEWHNSSIEEILRRLDEIPSEIRQTVKDQGGGHANHQFFWKIIKPGPETQPKGALLKSIEESFGSFQNFKDEFTSRGQKLLGSGWVFLVVDPKDHGRLKIVAYGNHESVLYHGTPGLLICDVWEHAYYLKYQNRRADYLKNFWSIVDWEVVASRLSGIREGRKQL